MSYLVGDYSAVFCGLAVLVGMAQALRAPQQRRELVALSAPMLGLFLWAGVVPVYVRAPFSAWPARAFLSTLCLAPAFCLVLPLLLGELAASSGKAQRSATNRLRYWTPPIVACAMAAVLMWYRGLDWVTGIGPDPVVLVSPWGKLAAAVSATTGGVLLVSLVLRFRRLVAVMPAITVGLVGCIASTFWLTTDLLRRGYLADTTLVSGAAFAGAAAAVWTMGMSRQVRLVPPLAPSRRLIYGATLSGLVVTYALGAKSAFDWISSLAQQTTPAILPALGFAIVAALVIIGADQRWRQRLWLAVGQHLFRSKHDYGEVWIHLTGLVSAAHTADELVQRVASFCETTLCVPAVSVWLVDSTGRLRRAAIAEDVRRMAASAADYAPALPAAHPVPVPPDANEMALGHALGASYACPMSTGGQLLGVLAVGQPRGQAGPDQEDQRVLRYIAAQVASALALYRLGEEIADVRAMGSFHRLSTFVLHDLKNLVSQQSFVLENAVKFRADPEFVSDALAAFDDSTNRMRSLISKLRSPHPEPSAVGGCDLIEVLQELLAMPQFAPGRRGDIEVRLPAQGQPCMVAIDRLALAQVLHNVLANARESLPDRRGIITVSLDRNAGRWRIQVRDNGRGMSETFLREYLFRPFRTTKEGGLGIGLYQCKTTVEAVGGTIAVESEENAGTTVALSFPDASVARERAAA